MLNIQCFVCNMLQENCYVVSDETRQCVIIDCGAYYPEEKAAIKQYISKNNLTPVHLLATHGHLDHNFGNRFVEDEYGLRVEVHHEDESYINKYEEQEDIFVDASHKLNLPKFVNAWDVRATLNKGPWSVLAEYAQKTQDPSFDNQYSYEKGSAALFSGSYSKKGLSLLFQVKRSENMAFRSRRKLDNLTSTSSYINHLPAFTQDQTYALAALYPYATQLADGEMAYQAEAGYNFKRKTALGGKYGMNVKVNFSHVRWKRTVNYQDIDVQLTKKLSKSFKLSLMYMNQRYNQFVVKKHSDENGRGDMINSNIFIADGKYQFSPKVTLRGELQYLTTGQDQGDWAYGLLELSLAPHWMITISDMWNCGGTKLHYYQGLVTYNVKQHRIQAGYGRTRKGLNCSGGVCREVPASTGWTLSYNYNF